MDDFTHVDGPLSGAENAVTPDAFFKDLDTLGALTTFAGESPLEHMRTLFAGEVPEATLHQLADAMRAIGTSMARIRHEQLDIGSRLEQALNAFYSAMSARYVKPNVIQKESLRLLYRFAKATMDLGHTSTSLYMRAYRKFADNADAVRLLHIGEMDLLLRRGITDETVEQILDIKRINPEIPVHEVKRLIAKFQEEQQARQVAEVRVEAALEQLAQSESELDNARIEERHTKELLKRVTAQQEADRIALSKAQADLSKRSSTMTTIEATLNASEARERALVAEVERLTSELDARAIPAPQIPAGFNNLDQAIQERRVELIEISKRVDSAREVQATLASEIDAQRSEIQQRLFVSNAFANLVMDIERVAETYHSTRAALKTSGNDPLHASWLETLRSVVAKLHQDLSSPSPEGSHV
jgi:hypothetical protein